jgi:hypothetical protein
MHNKINLRHQALQCNSNHQNIRRLNSVVSNITSTELLGLLTGFPQSLERWAFASIGLAKFLEKGEYKHKVLSCCLLHPTPMVYISQVFQLLRHKLQI